MNSFDAPNSFLYANCQHNISIHAVVRGARAHSIFAYVFIYQCVLASRWRIVPSYRDEDDYLQYLHDSNGYRWLTGCCCVSAPTAELCNTECTTLSIIFTNIYLDFFFFFFFLFVLLLLLLFLELIVGVVVALLVGCFGLVAIRRVDHLAKKTTSFHVYAKLWERGADTDRTRNRDSERWSDDKQNEMKRVRVCVWAVHGKCGKNATAGIAMPCDRRRWQNSRLKKRSEKKNK